MDAVLSYMLVGAVTYFFGIFIGGYIRKRNYKKEPVATLYIDDNRKLIRIEWNISVEQIPKDATTVLLDVERFNLNSSQE